MASVNVKNSAATAKLCLSIAGAVEAEALHRESFLEREIVSYKWVINQDEARCMYGGGLVDADSRFAIEL